MRVLVITNRYPVDADDIASPFVPHFVAALAKQKVTVDVLTPQYGSSEIAEPENIHRFRTGTTQPVGSWNLKSLSTGLRLVRFLHNGMSTGRDLCRANKYDHILALWALPSGHFARRLSHKFDIPYSVWCLGSDIYVWAERQLARGRISRILRDAHSVFADGNDLCTRVNSNFGVHCRFLPSCRPLEELATFTPTQATETPRFLYLGRLHEDKGVYELAEAFGRVRDRLPGATLRIVGDGPERARLEQLTGLTLAAGAVRIDGPLGVDGLIAALRTCDIVVIPSKSDSLPLVFSEAVQANRPVVGTDVGDLGAFIRSYRVGAVTASLEARDLAAVMLDMARAPVCDPYGRTELLRALDPQAAARTVCATALEPTEKPNSHPRQTYKVPGRVVGTPTHR